LGNASGAVIGALVFFLLSVGLGFLVYGIARRLLATGSMDERGSSRSSLPIGLGTVVGLGIFVVLYQTSIAGFRGIELSGDHLILHYTFPSQDLTYPAIHVTKVEKVPAFKGQWRLVVEDIDGARHYSALADQRDVDQAWSVLHPMIESSPGLRHPAS
jgi:hypothetical protein